MEGFGFECAVEGDVDLLVGGGFAVREGFKDAIELKLLVDIFVLDGGVGWSVDGCHDGDGKIEDSTEWVSQRGITLGPMLSGYHDARKGAETEQYVSRWK